MPYFQEDESRPILTEWISQGFEVDEHEIFSMLDWDEEQLQTDTSIAMGGAFVATGCAGVMLALGGVTFPMVVPMGMIAYGALTAWNSQCTKGERELEEQFLRDHPEILKAVAGKVASGESVNQISSAYSHAFRAYKKNDRAALRTIAGSMGSPLAQSDFQPSNGQDASNPKTETLAQTEIQPIAPGVAAAPSIQHITSPVWNPAQDLGENPQSALICGTPGSGKGMMISNAVRTLKSREPDLKILVIDPKGDPQEAGYWNSIADTYRPYCLMDCPDPDEGAAWLLNCMDEFRLMPGPKLLIFDELMAASTELGLADPKIKALQRLKKFIVGLVGQGDSRSVWIWAMTQSPQVADLGISGGARANLRVIGLVSPKNITAVEALTSTRLIPPPQGGMDELRKIMESSPCGRAVFDGKVGRWLPMPVLENHSGFDRDNRSIVAPTSSPPETQKLSQGQVNWERLKVDSPAYPDAKDAIDIQADEVETVAIDDKPDGLESYPLVLAVWEYLNGKEPRSLKQITMAIRKSGRISEDELRAKLGNLESYQEGISKVISFGASNGFLNQISDGAYEAIKKQ